MVLDTFLSVLLSLQIDNLVRGRRAKSADPGEGRPKASGNEAGPKESGNMRQTRLDNRPPVHPQPFGSFGDKSGWSGFRVSTSYLRARYLRSFERRRLYVQHSMQLITGQRLKSDFSFKMVNKVYVDGLKPYESTLTIMNEYNQIVGQWHCQSKSMHDEANKSLIRGVRRRYDLLKRPLPVEWATDDCCSSGGAIKDGMRMAEEELAIKLDILHFMKRLLDATYGVSHPAYNKMAQMLREAIFVCYPEDKERVLHELRELDEGQNGDEEWLDAVPEGFLLDRCRLRVRPRHQMEQLIARVLQVFHDTLYLVKGTEKKGEVDRWCSLVTPHTLKKFESCLPHIKKGCLEDLAGSDPYMRKPGREQDECAEGEAEVGHYSHSTCAYECASLSLTSFLRCDVCI
jgi:hypothetical protein